MAKFYVNSGDCKAIFDIPPNPNPPANAEGTGEERGPMDAAVRAYRLYGEKLKFGKTVCVSEAGFRDQFDMDAVGDRIFSLAKVQTISDRRLRRERRSRRRKERGENDAT